MEHRSRSLIIMKSTYSRLPIYYYYTAKMLHDGLNYVSANDIAKDLHLNPVLVRKDLASVSTRPGIPRRGFALQALYADIADHLGYNVINEAIIVGVGRLGRTLLSYAGFSELGLNIVAGFDNDENLAGIKIHEKMIFPMEKLPDLVKRLKVKIGIIAVPRQAAQNVCNFLIDTNIKAIWNFAPIALKVPQDILVKNENLAVSLATLSLELSKKLGGTASVSDKTNRYTQHDGHRERFNEAPE